MSTFKLALSILANLNRRQSGHQGSLVQWLAKRILVKYLGRDQILRQRLVREIPGIDTEGIDVGTYIDLTVEAEVWNLLNALDYVAQSQRDRLYDSRVILENEPTGPAVVMLLPGEPFDKQMSYLSRAFERPVFVAMHAGKTPCLQDFAEYRAKGQYYFVEAEDMLQVHSVLDEEDILVLPFYNESTCDKQFLGKPLSINKLFTDLIWSHHRIRFYTPEVTYLAQSPAPILTLQPFKYSGAT